MIAYLATDLVWASRIKAQADAQNLQSRRITSIDRLREILDADPEALILIDLEADIAEAVIDALRGPESIENAQKARTIAWGPHVMTDRLQAARQAGIDLVLPRGAFASKLSALLGEPPRDHP